MGIRLAQESDVSIVKEITHGTIREVYPHYYPKGAVDFFLDHHSDKNIKSDIADCRVFLCLDLAENVVGVVTIRGNEICRLFVPPQYQGNGYGSELLEFAEAEIAKRYGEIVLDTSLSAKSIYLKRGYQETAFHTIKTENGDFLCYDLMRKQIRRGN